MSQTIVVCGHGPGISDAVAKKFGAAGFSVALVARSKDKLEAAASKLNAGGVKAKAFPCDLSDLSAVTKMIADVRAALGPITVLHWNAYVGVAGDITQAPLGELQQALNVGVVGLVAAVQAALPDLKSQKNPAVLVTGGGFAFYDPHVDSAIVQYSAAGLAISKAAQHKLTGILSKRLGKDGIYVGEVVVLGTVKGTAFDRGAGPTLDPTAIAAKFWELYEKRRLAL